MAAGSDCRALARGAHPVLSQHESFRAAGRGNRHRGKSRSGRGRGPARARLDSQPVGRR